MDDRIEEKMYEVAEKLAKLGFIGTDVNPEISLFEYGLLWHPKSGTAIMTYPDYVWDEMEAEPLFEVQEIHIEEIIDVVEDMDDGFFSFIGEDKEEYLETLEEYPEWGANAISDVIAYGGTDWGYGYHMPDADLDDVVEYAKARTTNLRDY